MYNSNNVSNNRINNKIANLLISRKKISSGVGFLTFKVSLVFI